jgi:hypothetical protein
MLKDFIGGLLLLAFAVVYFYFSLGIQHSTLSDSVGADGFPKGLAYMLAGLSLIMIVKSAVLGIRAYTRGEIAMSIDPVFVRTTCRMLGMLAFAVGFLLILPYAGYILTTGLLVLAVALYQGRKLAWPVFATAIGGAVAFWLLFVVVLGIPLPSGSWFGGT